MTVKLHDKKLKQPLRDPIVETLHWLQSFNDWTVVQAEKHTKKLQVFCCFVRKLFNSYSEEELYSN